MASPARHGTACKACRRRGRKCDRTLPACLACSQRGAECEGYVTRWPGVAARGKFAGKTIPVLANDKSVVPARDTQSKPKAMPEQLLLLRPDDSASDYRDYSSPQTAGLREVSQAEIDRLVRHYVKDLSGIFFLGDGRSRNPMFHYVLPLLDNVPTIRYAIAGSAACHIAARASDRVLDEKSLSLRVRATQSLSESLNKQKPTSRQTTLASILMLAQLDMCSGDCVEFETHLQGAIAICRDGSLNHAANRYYFEQRLAWLDILSSTTVSRFPFFSLPELKTAIGRFVVEGHREWGYDVFPCPIDLCELLLDVSILYKSQAREVVPETQALEQADNLMRSLDKWPFLEQSPDTPRTHLVEAWRLGIMSYLERLFPSVHREMDMQLGPLKTRVLQHAGSIPPATPWSYALLWPIFQVGVSLTDEDVEEKAWIRRHLSVALGAVGCRHFSNALETLELAWGQQNRQNWSPLGTFGRTIMLG